PVRIALDPDQIRKHPLRIGLSMSVDVDLHNSDGALLPSKAVDQPVLSTDVYEHQVNEADALVQKIIQANLAASTNAQSAAAVKSN
ncbi:MAG TPA: multidrug transporter, partial [Xanthomonadaceae bacterium]|nr:multidrug transporter [Xanthomonadaceae bacterium]